jgi:hypothetical protein
MTRDEVFLLKLYEMALERGDPSEEIDRYAVGKAVGQNERGANNIARHLAQANFVKKGEGDALFLTPHGLKLVAQLLIERNQV